MALIAQSQAAPHDESPSSVPAPPPPNAERVCREWSTREKSYERRACGGKIGQVSEEDWAGYWTENNFNNKHNNNLTYLLLRDITGSYINRVSMVSEKIRSREMTGDKNQITFNNAEKWRPTLGMVTSGKMPPVSSLKRLRTRESITSKAPDAALSARS